MKKAGFALGDMDVQKKMPLTIPLNKLNNYLTLVLDTVYLYMKIKESLEEEIKLAENKMKSAKNNLGKIKDTIRKRVQSDNFDAETLECHAKAMRDLQKSIEESAEKINTYSYFLNLIRCEEWGLL